MQIEYGMARHSTALILINRLEQVGVTLTTRHLNKGDKIRLNGLGILQVRKRAARMGRNPATGEAIKIKASKKVAFRAAKELKEAV
jgi:DNA-binding protein HU-beta